MFVLDTNVVSELRRPEKVNPNVLAWAGSQPVACFFLSSITLLELELGIVLIKRKNAHQGAVLRAWMNTQVWSDLKGAFSPLMRLSRCAVRICMCRIRAQREMR